MPGIDNNEAQTSNTEYIVGPSTYLITNADDVVNVDTRLGAVTLYLPKIINSTPKNYSVNDVGNFAATNNITLLGIDNTINGSPSYVLDFNGGSLQAIITGQTEWLIISDRPESGLGTVTSVSIQALLSPIFTASISNPSTTPAITFALIAQSANLVYAGPASGGSANPTFRLLVASDIPLIPLATGVSGILPITNGGTGQSTANDAFNALAPSQTGQSGKYLTTDGVNTLWSVNPLGTVTSVDISGSDFTITGNPITTSGTINLVLANVNGNVGSFGSATQSGIFTVNAKGLITAASNVTITPAASSITGGQTLSRVDDTNVTLSLGGTPTTALLQAVSLTLGWSGVLSPTRGGTGVNNGVNTITIAGDFITTGAFNTTFAQQFSGVITLPNATSTLATLALSEALINKTGYNGLVITANTGVITTGTWNGTTIAIANGGTGQVTANAALNALLPSQAGNAGRNLQTDGSNVSWVADGGGTVTSVSATGSQGVTLNVATATTTPSITMSIGALTGVTSYNGLVITANTGVITSGSWNATIISAIFGGTGQSSYVVGDILYADTATSLAKLSDIATGNALISGGVATAPSWGKIGLTTHVSGVLPIANGGTNLSALGTAFQQLRVNAGATALEYFTDVTSTAFINGGNSFGGAASIGLNDNFQLNFKTNNATRFSLTNSGSLLSSSWGINIDGSSYFSSGASAFATDGSLSIESSASIRVARFGSPGTDDALATTFINMTDGYSVVTGLTIQSTGSADIGSKFIDFQFKDGTSYFYVDKDGSAFTTQDNQGFWVPVTGHLIYDAVNGKIDIGADDDITVRVHGWGSASSTEWNDSEIDEIINGSIVGIWTSTGLITTLTTFSLFNSTVTTVNAFGAATSLTIAPNITTYNFGNTTTAAQTVNVFTGSTGASTYNIATGATAAATTKTIRIGGSGVSGSTTNITIGSTVSGALGTIFMGQNVAMRRASLGDTTTPLDTNLLLATNTWTSGAVAGITGTVTLNSSVAGDSVVGYSISTVVTGTATATPTIAGMVNVTSINTTNTVNYAANAFRGHTIRLRTLGANVYTIADAIYLQFVAGGWGTTKPTTIIGLDSGNLGIAGATLSTVINIATQSGSTTNKGIVIGAGGTTFLPFQLTSGTSLTTALAGGFEFTADDLFFTITTGAARKNITLWNTLGTSGRVPFSTTNGRLTDDADMTFATDTLTVTKIIASTSLLSPSPSGGIGYSTGAGGTVTQATSKSTGVTLNTVTGQITMNAAALAAGTTVTFTLTDSSIASGDYVNVQHISGGTVGSYICSSNSAAGSATITVRNITTGSLSEAIVLKFIVFRAVTS